MKPARRRNRSPHSGQAPSEVRRRGNPMWDRAQGVGGLPCPLQRPYHPRETPEVQSQEEVTTPAPRTGSHSHSKGRIWPRHILPWGHRGASQGRATDVTISFPQLAFHYTRLSLIRVPGQPFGSRKRVTRGDGRRANFSSHWGMSLIKGPTSHYHEYDWYYP